MNTKENLDLINELCEYKFDQSDDKVGKLRIPYEHMERSRKSMECRENPRLSTDMKAEWGRKSVDCIDRSRN